MPDSDYTPHDELSKTLAYARQADLKVVADKLIEQYQRGLCTPEELATELDRRIQDYDDNVRPDREIWRHQP